MLRHLPHAFTLIELLVVVTIIVLLLTLLGPALESAVSRATGAVCASNTRQWAVAMRHYSIDQKGAAVFLDHSGTTGYWHGRLSPYLGQPGYARPGNPDGAMRVNVCPLTRVTEVASSRNPAGAQFATTTDVWTVFANSQGSYGLNLWTTNYPIYATNSEVRQENYFGRYSNVPGDSPFMGDSNWVGSWPDHNDLPIPDPAYEFGDVTHAAGRFLGRFLIARHGPAVNLSFADGSARRVGLGELWTLRWHRNSVANRDHLGDFSSP